MSMTDWAKREVQIALKRELDNTGDDKFDPYIRHCFNSALKAYESLAEDDHSGMSFSITSNILKRLMDGNCLTPIDDAPEVWRYAHTSEDGTAVYQCKRMSRLFKRVHPDGSVTYSDCKRYYCQHLEKPELTFTGGIVKRLVDELYPITMPYYPVGKYVFGVEKYLSDERNGDFDTVIVAWVIEPNGEKKVLDLMYGEVDGKMIEIDEDEFNKRVQMHFERLGW